MTVEPGSTEVQETAPNPADEGQSDLPGDVAPQVVRGPGVAFGGDDGLRLERTGDPERDGFRRLQTSCRHDYMGRIRRLLHSRAPGVVIQHLDHGR